jgi:hypothetical protein
MHRIVDTRSTTPPSTPLHPRAAAMTHANPILAACLLFTVAAHAADAPPPAQQASQSVAIAASGAASTPALICHRETPTGSTIAHKVCRTQEQIDADGRNADDVKRRIQYEAGAAAQQRLKGQ